MRQALTGVLHQRFTYYILLALLFILLAFIGPAGSPLGTNVQGEEDQSGEAVAGETGQLNELPTSADDSNNPPTNEKSSNGTNSTKIHVSVNSSTNNEGTSGSTKVEVTTNGQTQDFSEALEDCLESGDIRVSTKDTKIECESEDGSVEIDWDSDSDEDQENESSMEQEVRIKRETD
jgi:hypothetical protein